MKQSIHSVLIALTLIACLDLGNATGQSLIQVANPDRRQTYAPEDYDQRGWVYRTQAGYSGLFRNCDDDAAKRCSPYIHWQTPTNCSGLYRSERPFLATLDQIDEGIRRVVDGAGCCTAPSGNRCQHARLIPTLIYGFQPSRHSCTCHRGTATCQSCAQSTNVESINGDTLPPATGEWIPHDPIPYPGDGQEGWQPEVAPQPLDDRTPMHDRSNLADPMTNMSPRITSPYSDRPLTSRELAEVIRLQKEQDYAPRSIFRSQSGFSMDFERLGGSRSNEGQDAQPMPPNGTSENNGARPMPSGDTPNNQNRTTTDDSTIQLQPPR